MNYKVKRLLTMLENGEMQDITMQNIAKDILKNYRSRTLTVEHKKIIKDWSELL